MKKYLIFIIIINLSQSIISQNSHFLNTDSVLLHRLKNYLNKEGDYFKEEKVSIGVTPLFYNNSKDVGIFKFRARASHANTYLFIWEGKKAKIIKHYESHAVLRDVSKFTKKQSDILDNVEIIKLLNELESFFEQRNNYLQSSN